MKPEVPYKLYIDEVETSVPSETEVTYKLYIDEVETSVPRDTGSALQAVYRWGRNECAQRHRKCPTSCVSMKFSLSNFRTNISRTVETFTEAGVDNMEVRVSWNRKWPTSCISMRSLCIDLCDRIGQWTLWRLYTTSQPAANQNNTWRVSTLSPAYSEFLHWVPLTASFYTGSHLQRVSTLSPTYSEFLHWVLLTVSFYTGSRLQGVSTLGPAYSEFLHWVPLTASFYTGSHLQRVSTLGPVYSEFLHWVPLTASFYTGSRLQRVSTLHPAYSEFLHWVPLTASFYTGSRLQRVSTLGPAYNEFLHWVPLTTSSIRTSNYLQNQNHCQQESPPEWPQEAYRPRHSLSDGSLGGGVPPVQFGGGWVSPVLSKGTPWLQVWLFFPKERLACSVAWLVLDLCMRREKGL